MKKVSVRENLVHDAAMHPAKYCMSEWTLHPLEDAGDRSGAALRISRAFSSGLSATSNTYTANLALGANESYGNPLNIVTSMKSCELADWMRISCS